MIETSLPTTTRTALKEWAVACEALGRGDQLLLLRKGGISEVHKEFRVEHPEFLLFPTYEHQRDDLVKPFARPMLARTLAERGATDRVKLRFWARVVEGFDVHEPDRLDAASGLHLWSDSYAHERLRWRPTKPLQLLALRVYELAEPVELPLLAEYGGCKSWLTFAEPVVLEGARPVLDEAAFAARLAAVRQVLGQASLETSAP